MSGADASKKAISISDKQVFDDNIDADIHPTTCLQPFGLAIKALPFGS